MTKQPLCAGHIADSLLIRLGFEDDIEWKQLISGELIAYAAQQCAEIEAQRDQAITHVKLLQEALKAGNRWFMPHDTTGIDEIDQKRRKEYQAWAEQYEQALDATDKPEYQ